MGLPVVLFWKQSTTSCTKRENGELLLVIAFEAPVANTYIPSPEGTGNFARSESVWTSHH